MEEQEILEGNKLIDSFMPNDRKYWNREGFLRYDLSWDFLMRVIEKISKENNFVLSSVGMWACYINRKDSDDMKEKILKEKMLSFKPLGGKNMTENEFKDAKLEGWLIPFLEAMEDFSSQSKPDDTFWGRLELFVSNVKVNDMMSEEEKQYILRTCKKLKK